MDDGQAVLDLDLMTEQQHAIATKDSLCELLQWIDVTKRLPDSGIAVLCWIQEHSDYLCCYWDDDKKHWISCETRDVWLGVTHWTDPRGPVAC